MRVWIGIGELIPSPKLILDTFLHIWFHIREEFIIDYELKQLLVAFALDPKFDTEFYS